jgi:hypothetical protein
VGDGDPVVVGLGVGVGVVPHSVVTAVMRGLAAASLVSRSFWAARTAAWSLVMVLFELPLPPPLPLLPLPLLPLLLPPVPLPLVPLVVLLLVVLADEVWLAWSVARRTVAVATEYWSALTWEASDVVLSRAMTCPALTCEPRLTETEATCPETGKLTLAWLTGSIVPVSSRVWVTFARVTVAVR